MTRLPSTENEVQPPAPGLANSSAVFSPNAGLFSEGVADRCLDNAASASSLPQVLTWSKDATLSDTPIIQYPGAQYFNHGLGPWFTNHYSVGGGMLGVDAVVRSYYLNDQRIQWSGQEETFAAEGALTSRYERCLGDVRAAVGADFFITQPYDRNMLDGPERRSYFANYDFRPFDISQLYVEMQKDSLTCRVGKMITPFGRYYYPVDTNLQFDAPFIRTEAIRRRETGVLLSSLGERLSTDIGIFNGCDDRDTNSSKACVGRLGYNFEPFTVGISGKVQDGIGSENQKAFNNHLGADACWRARQWTVSGEVLYDEYGLYHEFDANSIFWEHSIYYRDVNRGEHSRITGVGWYLDCLFRGELWLVEFNFGQYYPQNIGISQHDAVNHRGIIRVGYDIGRHLQIYNVVMIESGLSHAQAGRDRKSWVEMGGLQYLF